MRRAISGGAIGLLLGGVLVAPAAAQRVEIPVKETALQGTPAQVFSVGTEEGRDWEMLARVTSVAFDRQDNLYVLDAGNYRVLVFDRNGKFVRQIGKQGSGPGEITFAMAMTILPDGNLAINDAGRSGFTIFAPDGTYVKNVSGGSGVGGMMGSNAIAAAPQGGVITQVRPTLRAEGGPIDPAALAKSRLVRTPLTDNATPVTLFEIVTEAPKVQQQGSSGRVSVMIRSQTFAPQPSWGVLPSGGVAVLNGLDYRVQVTDAAGKVVRTLEKSEKPRAVSRRDQDDAREATRTRLKNGGGGGIQVRNNNGQTSYSFGGGGGGGMTDDQINERLRDMEFAETMPVVQRIRTDPTGRIWVQRTPAVGSDGGPIDLLTDAAYVGTLRNAKLPDAVSASGLAAYIEADELDVQHVVVRRLPATWK
jgi:hypothetical protein